MSDEQRPETERLRKALRSGNRHERAEAAARLGDAGVRGALPEIDRLTEDADDLVAVSALYAAWRLGGGVRGVTRVAAALASDDEETMQLAVMALCEIGEDAVPDLERMLDEKSAARVEVVRILGEIGGEQAKRAVRRVAESGDHETRREARRILAEDRD